MDLAIELTRRGIPVALISGNPRAIDALDRSAWMRLLKPFRVRDLLELVATLLRACAKAGVEAERR